VRVQQQCYDLRCQISSTNVSDTSLQSARLFPSVSADNAAHAQVHRASGQPLLPCSRKGVKLKDQAENAPPIQVGLRRCAKSASSLSAANARTYAVAMLRQAVRKTMCVLSLERLLLT